MVKVYRFSDLEVGKPKLLFDDIDITSTNYLTISHVWGPLNLQAYRNLDGIDPLHVQYTNSENDGKVWVTKHKADFLSKRLPQLVQDRPFCMDVLCVDQEDDDAKIAIVDLIPENLFTLFSTQRHQGR